MNALIQDLLAALPPRQVITDDLRRLAYGTDASFYRLVPKIVAQVNSESEIAALLALAHQHRVAAVQPHAVALATNRRERLRTRRCARGSR